MGEQNQTVPTKMDLGQQVNRVWNSNPFTKVKTWVRNNTIDYTGKPGAAENKKTAAYVFGALGSIAYLTDSKLLFGAAVLATGTAVYQMYKDKAAQ